MFEKTSAYRHMLKRKYLEDELEKARNNNDDWKIRQLEGKLASFNSKYYSNIIWNSSNGTYKKENKEK